MEVDDPAKAAEQQAVAPQASGGPVAAEATAP